MPSVAVKLYSVFFKFLLKQRLQSWIQDPIDESSNPYGVTTRPEESVSAPNPCFTDGVATKDIHIDPFTALCIRIFLPESSLSPPEQSHPKSHLRSSLLDPNSINHRRNSYAPSDTGTPRNDSRRSSLDGLNSRSDNNVYRGYSPQPQKCRKLPIMLQFHGGGWVSGSNESVANDFFCRRIAKLCDVIVVAVGYRLAPENKYPAAFDDGLKVLNWLGKQANLAECCKSMGSGARGVGAEFTKAEVQRHIVDAFGASMVEPWLAAHGDPSRFSAIDVFLAGDVICIACSLVYRFSAIDVFLAGDIMCTGCSSVYRSIRCVLLGVSCGANIADYVACKAIEAGKRLDPVKVVAQVLMYPFFIGSIPTKSETRLANSYFYDMPMCLLAWKLFLPEEKFSLDHPAGNPLILDRSLKRMPPTLTIVAEHDWMRDRAIAYSEALRNVNVDAPVLEYKDAVHEFATLDMLLKTPQAQACAEDIAIWVKKYISFRGNELSY
ncbi:putative carboxylesterase 11 -like protein [Gossypium arboreum]|uniref:Putative carboxylesterase 11-like protein n=1 Tax=Gossypium arboreum TaxID=29729 RepID=A0A0B0PHW0_GOSAR|nr:putative carboxylesterase 11 -like protein [Gossypium arboreum]